VIGGSIVTLCERRKLLANACGTRQVSELAQPARHVPIMIAINKRELGFV
jgi:hypothetical protein